MYVLERSLFIKWKISALGRDFPFYEQRFLIVYIGAQTAAFLLAEVVNSDGRLTFAAAPLANFVADFDAAGFAGRDGAARAAGGAMSRRAPGACWARHGWVGCLA